MTRASLCCSSPLQIEDDDVDVATGRKDAETAATSPTGNACNNTGKANDAAAGEIPTYVGILVER